MNNTTQPSQGRGPGFQCSARSRWGHVQHHRRRRGPRPPARRRDLNAHIPPTTTTAEPTTQLKAKTPSGTAQPRPPMTDSAASSAAGQQTTQSILDPSSQDTFLSQRRKRDTHLHGCRCGSAFSQCQQDSPILDFIPHIGHRVSE